MALCNRLFSSLALYKCKFEFIVITFYNYIYLHTSIFCQLQVSVVLSVFINAGMVGIECFYFAFRGRQILNHKCFIVIGTTCMSMDIVDKCFYMSHERQMKLIFQIDIDYPQGYYQVIMAQLEMWPVAL